MAAAVNTTKGKLLVDEALEVVASTLDILPGLDLLALDRGGCSTTPTSSSSRSNSSNQTQKIGTSRGPGAVAVTQSPRSIGSSGSVGVEAHAGGIFQARGLAGEGGARAHATLRAQQARRRQRGQPAGGTGAAVVGLPEVLVAPDAWLATRCDTAATRCEALRRLAEVLPATPRNQVVCARARTTRGLVRFLAQCADGACFRAALALLAALGRFSAGTEVKTLYAYATDRAPLACADAAEHGVRRLAVLRCLTTMLCGCAHASVSDFFWFSHSQAAIEVDSETVFDRKWPGSYFASVWVLFDRLPARTRNTPVMPYEPRLFCFVSAAAVGVEVYVSGADLVVRTSTRHAVRVPCALEPNRWYHIVLSHTLIRELFSRSSRMSVFVNGAPASEVIADYPATTGVLAQRTIGNVSQKCASSAHKSTVTALQGKISSFALGYDAHITPDQARDLYQRGPSFVPTTFYLRSIRCPGTIDVVYTPQALSPNPMLCISANYANPESSFLSTLRRLGAAATVAPPVCARLLNGALLVRTLNPLQHFHALVGVPALFPLFHKSFLLPSRSFQSAPGSSSSSDEQGQQTTAGAICMDPAEALQVATELLNSVLSSTPNAVINYITAHGSTVLSRLVADYAATHGRALTEGVLDAFMALSRTLLRFGETREDAYAPLLLNFGAWKFCSKELQHKLAGKTLEAVSVQPDVFRELHGIEKILAQLQHYSFIRTDDPRLAQSGEDLVVLRSVVCMCVETLFGAARSSVTAAEVAALVDYIEGNSEVDIVDCVQLFVRVMHACPTVAQLLAEQHAGMKVFTRLLGCTTPQLRKSALQLIALFYRWLQSVPQKESRRLQIIEISGEQIRQSLALFRFDWDTYLHLVQLLALDFGKGLQPRSLTVLACGGAGAHRAYPLPDAMGVVLDLLCAATRSAALPASSNAGNVVRICEDLAGGIEVSAALQDVVLANPLWQWWLTNMLVVASEGRRHADRPLGAMTGALMRIAAAVMCRACGRPGGWGDVERFVLVLISTYCEDALAMATDALTLLMRRIAAAAVHAVPAGTHPTLFTNLCHVLQLVEFVVYSAEGVLCQSLACAQDAAATVAPHSPAGDWRFFTLCDTTLHAFDKLWCADDALRPLCCQTISTHSGSKQPAYVIALRLALSLFREGRQHFALSSAASASSGTTSTIGGGGDAFSRFYCGNFSRFESIVQWLINKSRVSNRELGPLLLWTLHELLATVAHSTLEADMYNMLLLQLCCKVAKQGRAALQLVLPQFAEPPADSTGGAAGAGAGMAPGSLGSFLFSSRKEAAFLQQWVVPALVNSTADVATVDALERECRNFEAGVLLFGEACEARYRAYVTHAKAAIVDNETRNEEHQQAFAKELLKRNTQNELRAVVEREKAAFRRAKDRQTLHRMWKEIVRACAGPSGCWSYRMGCRLFSAFEPAGARRLASSTSTEDDDNRRLEQENQDMVVWTVDTSHAVGAMRPFLKIDFHANNTPRFERQQAAKVKHEVERNDKELAKILHAKEEAAAEAEADDVQDAASPQPDASASTTTPADDGDALNDEWCVMDTTSPSSSSSSSQGNRKHDSQQQQQQQQQGTTVQPQTVVSTTVVAAVENGSLPRTDEEYQLVVPCSRVYLFDKTPGTLCLTVSKLYFFLRGDVDGSEGYHVWELTDICQIFNRKYVASSAMEFFVGSSGRGYLFEFEHKKALVHAATQLASAVTNASGHRVDFIKDPRRVFKKEGWTAMWQRKEITNFQYLMVLNKYAGRTLNDVAQYPVFPWVLADYRSESVDWSNPALFRDLSKPVGALNEERLRVFVKRYEEMKEDGVNGPVPPFLYGSHYSTVGAVTFWLTRLEPFSRVARELQGGCFDYPDRLFFNLDTAWENCLTSSSDVKELIPEFFYMAEFFVNTNRYWLGRRQNGDTVADVRLPRYTRGSPDLFVRFNAEALESPFVSAHLGEWIDLIFGYKQRGRAAEDAHNVFYYLTYPDAVDASAAEGDSVDATALRTQLAYFGQCPLQLFTAAHPARDATGSLETGAMDAPHAAAMPLACRILTSECTMPAAGVGTGDYILTIHDDAGLRLCQVLKQQQSQQQSQAQSQAQQHSLAQVPQRQELEGETEMHALPVLLCAPVVAHHMYPGYVFATTLWGSALCLYNAATNTIVQIEDASFVGDVTTLVMSADGTRLAVGGTAGLAVVFRVTGGAGHAPHLSQPRSDFVILRGQETAITAIAFDPNNAVCATGAQDGRVCVHLLDTGRIVSAFPERSSGTASGGTASGTGTAESEEEQEEETHEVLSMAFTRQCDVVVVRAGAAAAWVYSANGRLVERLGLEDRQPLQVLVLFDDVGQNDQIAVVDRDGITFVTVRLFALPRTRKCRRWPLPHPFNSYWVRFVTPWVQAPPPPDGDSAAAAAAAGAPPPPHPLMLAPLRRHARQRTPAPPLHLLLFCESYTALQLTQPTSIVVSLTWSPQS